MDDDRDRGEWATWSSHNYAKAFQPRSVLRAGLLGSVLVVALVVALMLFAGR